jgi:hypothetical protein
MLNAFTACIAELDDVELAISQINEQLAPKIKATNGFLKNTVGILCCHYEFVGTGVIEAVCKNFNFPIIGETTVFAGVSPATRTMLPTFENTQMVLSLMILTSDDIEFTIRTTESLTGLETFSEKTQAFSTAFEGMQDAKLVCNFSPIMSMYGLETLIPAILKTAGNIPLFGGFSSDDSPTFSENCYAVTSEGVFDDRMAFLFFKGNVTPQFYTGCISNEKNMTDPAIITAAEGSRIIEINNKPVKLYLEKIGLYKILTSGNPASNVVLLIKDSETSIETARTAVALTPNGELFCGAEIKTGSIIRTSLLDRKDIHETSRNLIRKVEKSDRKVSFMVSCVSRAVILGTNSTEGFDMLCSEISDDKTVLLNYAAGEFCPKEDTEGNYVNQFNFITFCICSL